MILYLQNKMRTWNNFSTGEDEITTQRELYGNFLNIVKRQYNKAIEEGRRSQENGAFMVILKSIGRYHSEWEGLYQYISDLRLVPRRITNGKMDDDITWFIKFFKDVGAPVPRQRIVKRTRRCRNENGDITDCVISGGRKKKRKRTRHRRW